jgi:glycosyltransferase involved in cell wall biosynthesis
VYPAVAPDFVPLDDNGRRRARAALGLSESLLVLNVKRLHELAGQRFLLEAFARATAGRTDVRLVLCGAGPLREALQQQARDLGIADRVTFAGLVPNADVARYAAAADVFVLPSLLEALPTVAVEALAAGTPVVSADHPGGVELHAIFGDDVRLVPRRQAAPLGDAIADALDHPRRVSASTLERIGELFGPAAIAHAYEQVYERAAGGRVAGGRTPFPQI